MTFKNVKKSVNCDKVKQRFGEMFIRLGEIRQKPVF